MPRIATTNEASAKRTRQPRENKRRNAAINLAGIVAAMLADLKPDGTVRRIAFTYADAFAIVKPRLHESLYTADANTAAARKSVTRTLGPVLTDVFTSAGIRPSVWLDMPPVNPDGKPDENASAFTYGFTDAAIVAAKALDKALAEREAASTKKPPTKKPRTTKPRV